MNPDSPVYIISKGRWESRLTVKALERIGVPYTIIVEESEYPEYSKVINPDNIRILPQHYLDNYDTCDEEYDNPNKGSGAARNFAWDLALETGSKWHWLLDDNIDDFHRLNRNEKGIVTSGTIFKVAEDFVNRYTNIALAGFNYYSFCKSTDRVPPFVWNTRIYSCLLIRTDMEYRWRGRYNEDTDLSLRILKDGHCTLLFNAFLCGKTTTRRMRGGNTDTIYQNGTLKKSQMIANLHPDVAEVVWKFNRWHHKVNYKPFKNNKPMRKEGLVLTNKVNNYGMKLVEKV